MTARPIALVYDHGQDADAVLRDIARGFATEGRLVAGLLPRDVQRPGRSRCDMMLDDPASGESIRISEDRGEHARGCRLDRAELLRAGEVLRRSLARGPDVVLINKFGKAECEGGGLRDVLVAIVASGTPLVIGVPRRNLDAWRAFAGSEMDELALDGDANATLAALRPLLPGRATSPAGT